MQHAIKTESFAPDVSNLVQEADIAQNADDLKRAEELYLMALDEDPQHPDANHNLGILYLSVNLSEKALPRLRKALDVHPEFDHFWVSYFHGLVYNKMFTEGQEILEAGKENGLDRNTLAKLQEILASAPDLGIEHEVNSNLTARVVFIDEEGRSDINEPAETGIENILKRTQEVSLQAAQANDDHADRTSLPTEMEAMFIEAQILRQLMKRLDVKA
jgi:tetratricopeptide (TPR) repeat protein